MEVKIGKSYLTKISHEGRELTFQYPAFKGTYANVAEQIDKAKLKRPNSSETASLVYDAWKTPNEKYSQEIIKILRDNWFWEYTGNLYLPKSNEEINNGVILDLDSQNLKFENGKLIMDKPSLIERLKNNDSLVKFVPFGYKIEFQNLFEFQKNLYIVERYGKEGAEKIAEIASKYKCNPCLWSFNSVNREEARMSALDDYWLFGDGLNVNGGSWNDVDNGRAFRVCKEEE
ncbi:MAG: hypothetical protein AABX44_00385 [Nanoarchaeota archaeon]